jgi:hypothetical protein
VRARLRRIRLDDHDVPLLDELAQRAIEGPERHIHICIVQGRSQDLPPAEDRCFPDLLSTQSPKEGAGGSTGLGAAVADKGEEYMRPMVLRDVAEAIEMHESTVSRVTTGKYMHTPRGVFEFRYFFSSHLSSDDGEQSSTAVRAKIRKLVAAEDPEKPLSDNQIARLLSDEGIKVARRTIAKYREALNIPSSSDRKRNKPLG